MAGGDRPWRWLKRDESVERDVAYLKIKRLKALTALSRTGSPKLLAISDLGKSLSMYSNGLGDRFHGFSAGITLGSFVALATLMPHQI